MSIVNVAENAANKVPSVEDIKKDIEQKKDNEEIKEDVEISDDPKLNEKYTFNLDYKDPRGKIWKGEFTNKILTNAESIQVAVTRARMLGGVSVNSIDLYTYELSERLAHLTWSLIKRPKWANDLSSLLDPMIIEKLYQEVTSHEDTFHGRGKDKEESTSATENI